MGTLTGSQTGSQTDREAGGRRLPDERGWIGWGTPYAPRCSTLNSRKPSPLRPLSQSVLGRLDVGLPSADPLPRSGPEADSDADWGPDGHPDGPGSRRPDGCQTKEGGSGGARHTRPAAPPSTVGNRHPSDLSASPTSAVLPSDLRRPIRRPGQVPKSNPGTETRGISCPITRSIVRTMPISSALMNVYASPVLAARPVRPMRCT